MHIGFQTTALHITADAFCITLGFLKTVHFIMSERDQLNKVQS